MKHKQFQLDCFFLLSNLFTPTKKFFSLREEFKEIGITIDLEIIPPHSQTQIIFLIKVEIKIIKMKIKYI